MRAGMLLMIALCLPAPAGGAELERRLDAALADAGLRGARVAALVVDRETGDVLYARDPDRPLVPASNQKILTAVGALAAFGPTHRFVTDVYADRDLETGLVGWLGVRGGGDPALTSEDMWRLAADLRALGLRRVSGPLILDDSGFDRERWHPSWGSVSARAYHAPVGALSANYGAFAVAVRAGTHSGAPVSVLVDPPLGYLRVTNRAGTAPPGGARALIVERKAGPEREEVMVSGSLPVGDARVLHRSVLDPTRYAGAVLRMQLAANGIEVAGPTQIGPLPEGATPLLAFRGRTLAEVVRLFLKYSNNAIAESLVKALGARESGEPGTWSNGVPALRHRLAELGLDTRPLTLVDGSGLSYENRVTPRSLVEALRLARDSFRFGPEFEAALPIAAEDGTLKERAEGASGVARAKTGLLTRVTGLSGYAQRPDGSRAVFSILVNGYRAGDDAAMRAVDGFVEELVRAPDAAGLAVRQERRPSLRAP